MAGNSRNFSLWLQSNSRRLCLALLVLLYLGRSAPLVNFNADGDVFGDDDDIEDYANDESSVELHSSLFDPSTPTYLSEDDSDFTSKYFSISLFLPELKLRENLDS